jgi:hypothetical protein
MIISHDAQLSSTTTTTRMTRYFSATSMLIFSMRPFFPLIFPISRVSHLPLSVFLTSSSSLPLPHFVFLTSSSSLRLPHLPSSSLRLPHFLFLTSSSSLHLPHSVFLISHLLSVFLTSLPHSVFLAPSSSLSEHLQRPFIFSHFCPMMQTYPFHCPHHSLP